MTERRCPDPPAIERIGVVRGAGVIPRPGPAVIGRGRRLVTGQQFVNGTSPVALTGRTKARLRRAVRVAVPGDRAEPLSLRPAPDVEVSPGSHEDLPFRCWR